VLLYAITLKKSPDEIGAGEEEIAKRKSELVRALLKNDADVNARMADGTNAFWHAASGCGNGDMMGFLFLYGADVNARRRADEYTALHIAVTRSQPAEHIETICKLKCGIDLEDLAGQTALYKALSVLASNELQKEVVKILMQYGAKIDAGKEGNTPLDSARQDLSHWMLLFNNL
jgi:ankyrin repeat protein